MIITEKMIRELQRRVDISYEEAERFLRRAGGNIDIAQSYANRRANSFGNRLFRELEKMINATLIYRVKVFKKEDLLINLPLLGFIIVLFLVGLDKFLLLGAVFIVLALLTDCDLQINKVENQEAFRFYRTVNKKDIHSTTEQNQTKETTDATNTQKENVSKDETVSSQLDSENPLQDSIQIEIKEETIVKNSTGVNETKTTESTSKDLFDDNDDDYYEVTIDK